MNKQLQAYSYLHNQPLFPYGGQMLQNKDMSGMHQQVKQKFTTVLKKPHKETYKFLLRYKLMNTYQYRLRLAQWHQQSINQLSEEQIQSKLQHIDHLLTTNTLTLAGLKKKEQEIKTVLEVLSEHAYEQEYRYYTEDIKRIKRAAEYESWVRKNEAAVDIQRIYRGTIEKEHLLKILEYKYYHDMEVPSLKIQAIYRSLQAQQSAKKAYLVSQLRNKLKRSALTIQKHIRSYQAKKKAKIQHLIEKIIEIRNKAATLIQTNYKRYKIQQLYRKVQLFEKNFISIKWSCEDDVLPDQVQVVGTFTNPAWEKKIELDYCPLRSIYIKYMNNLNRGTYQLKFIVDGVYRCDPNLPTKMNASGQLNNILKIDANHQVVEVISPKRKTAKSDEKHTLSQKKLLTAKPNIPQSHRDLSQYEEEKIHGGYNIGDVSTKGSTQRDRYSSFDNENREVYQPQPTLSELHKTSGIQEEFKENDIMRYSQPEMTLQPIATEMIDPLQGMNFDEPIPQQTDPEAYPMQSHQHDYMDDYYAMYYYDHDVLPSTTPQPVVATIPDTIAQPDSPQQDVESKSPDQLPSQKSDEAFYTL